MEDRIRLRAFQWLKDQEAIYGDILPVSKQQWPDRERLSIRYDSFLNAV